MQASIRSPNPPKKAGRSLQISFPLSSAPKTQAKAFSEGKFFIIITEKRFPSHLPVLFPLQLMGGSPVSVDDNALCLYRTQSGVMGQMHVSWTNYGEENNSTQIYGTKGVLRLYDDPECSLVLERRDGETTRLKLDELTSNKKQTSGQRTSTGVIDAFVRAVVSGEPSVIDAEEALKAMRVIFAASRSAQEGQTLYVRQD